LELVAQDGTEYKPQCMKMPNLALVNHSGIGRLSSDSQLGSNFCANPVDKLTKISAINSKRFIFFKGLLFITF